LIAQAERLAAAAVRAGVRANPMHDGGAQHALAISTSVRHALAQLATTANPYDSALQLVMQESYAKAGFLFLLVGDRLQLAAASTGGEPPAAAQERLLSELLQARHLAKEDDTDTVAVASAPLSPEKSVFIDAVSPRDGDSLGSSGAQDCYRTLGLTSPQGGRIVVVGGIVLLDPERVMASNSELLEPIASALHERASSAARSTATTGPELWKASGGLE
jgi:hypothetical protein